VHLACTWNDEAPARGPHIGALTWGSGVGDMVIADASLLGALHDHIAVWLWRTERIERAINSVDVGQKHGEVRTVEGGQQLECTRSRLSRGCQVHPSVRAQLAPENRIERGGSYVIARSTSYLLNGSADAAEPAAKSARRRCRHGL
jgi:hypothetical protein